VAMNFSDSDVDFEIIAVERSFRRQPENKKGSDCSEPFLI
jgi:hypothetical protein